MNETKQNDSAFYLACYTATGALADTSRPALHVRPHLLSHLTARRKLPPTTTAGDEVPAPTSSTANARSPR